MRTNLIKKNEPPNSERFNKRREVSKEECLHDLRGELPKIFTAYIKGVEKYNKVMEEFPLEARIRLDAPLLVSCIIQQIQKRFPDNWKFGRYKRFTLRISDYLILFKKLNNNNKPMNIKTKHVNSISNQLQLSLFNDDSFFTDPILFFGYKKDKSGEVISPQVVYIDEDSVKWIISENEIVTKLNKEASLIDNTGKDAQVSVKENLKRGKASNQ